MKDLNEMQKADLHIHFEGSVSHDIFKKLAQKNKISFTSAVNLGGDLIYPPQNLENSFPVYDNFITFVRTYVKISECLNREEDILEIGKNLVNDFNNQNIKYADIYFSPNTFIQLGKTIEPLFDGLKEVEKLASEAGIKISWIFDIVRNSSIDGFEVLALADQARERGVSVKYIGLAGHEFGYPAKNFSDALNKARSNGYKILAHAGETDGAESVWETIKYIKPERIGHGVRAVEDKRLIEYLAKEEIVLEVCPWSNILLGVYQEKEHPLVELVRSNVSIVISSDDPGLFNKSLDDNFLLASKLGLSDNEIEKIISKSLDVSKL